MYLKFELVGSSVGENAFVPTKGPKEHLWVKHCADCAMRRTHPHAKERVLDVTLYTIAGVHAIQLTLQMVSNPHSPIAREFATRKRYVAENRAVCGVNGCEVVLMRDQTAQLYCPIGHADHPASPESARSNSVFLEKRVARSRVSYPHGERVLLEIYEQYLASIANHKRMEFVSPLSLL